MATALTALLLLAAMPVRAATYVVDPAGSDAGDGSALQPWGRIRRAAAAVRPGDVVTVHAGRYVESVGIPTSGTGDAPIVYRADPGAVLESPDPTASLSAFDLAAGVGYIVLDGFTARGGFDETIMLRAGVHDVTVRNCELSGDRVGVWIGDATNVTVDGCSIHDNSGPGLRIAGSRDITVRDTVSIGNDDGLGCNGVADGFAVDETSAHVTFIGCRAQGNSDDGFDVKADAALLTAVESRDNRCTGVKLWQNARLENALVVGNTSGVGTGSLFGALTVVEVINSTIADNTGTQIGLGRSPTPTAYTVLLRNDIAAGAGKAVEADWPVVLLEDHNLLFRPDTTSAVIVRHLADGTERLYSGQAVNAGTWAAESGQGTGTLAVDPDFADPTYRVALDSAAVDRGTATGAPATDRAGTMRPLGNAVDIGPDELDVAVANHPPWADPGPARTLAVGARVRLQGFGSVDPDGNALTYAWDFGDGSPPASGYTMQHAYGAAGDYVLALTVSDGTLAQTRAAAVHVVGAPLPSPTAAPTPTPAGGHDSQIRVAPHRMLMRLAKGSTRVVRRVRVVVRNADVPEVPGHVIRVVVDPGDCPPSIIGAPSIFAPSGADMQDGTVVAGGRGQHAFVSLALDRALVQTPDPGTPFRCHLSFTAVGPGTDPTPWNNVAALELQLLDENDF